MSVFLLFIDGVGLGEPADWNPWYTEPTPHLEQALGGISLIRDAVGRHGENCLLLSTDAGLGVEGLPQSATGQATIFTGRNGPKAMGEHQRGLPFRRLREWVERDNLYRQADAGGWKATFANSYTREFFELPTTRRGWISVSTATMLSSGQPLRMLDQLLKGCAVHHDLTRRSLVEKNPEVPVIEPELAARHLLGLGTDYDVVVHEFFLTDLAGHRRDPVLAGRVIREYDRFFGAVLLGLREEDTVVLVSDHGNSEDLRTKTHTSHPVPTLVAGAGTDAATRFAAERPVWDLTGITPLLLHLLKQTDGKREERGEGHG
ncbi:hypothetical protein ACFQ49_06625 [Kroppenstedtia eburnea]|uniref:Phosphoglycerate mutase n=1 Tax=Kroppenstedtia eburnea TaxID=714067 RepID=A0A1N7PEW1_9BACL|nr:hypothetical protein [Kroppenstedtia eburnea]QKI83314.1 hypothetical protein GXN75_15695 [Kroppenstedtia eburnea]SIT09173.1 phosphoglycerate mutase [Kroppenstedtia eburnea]